MITINPIVKKISIAIVKGTWKGILWSVNRVSLFLIRCAVLAIVQSTKQRKLLN